MTRSKLSGLSFHKIILYLFIISAVVSCEYKNIEDIDDLISYSNDIAPIIKTNCSVTGCHVPGATTGDMNNYSVLKSNIDNGKFQLMVFELKLMPPVLSGSLMKEDITKLKTWVAQGAGR